MGIFCCNVAQITNLFPCLRPEIIDPLGDSPLHIAIKEKDEPRALRLVKKGANVNATNKDGFTPLHYAVKFGRPNLIPALIENGGDLDIAGFHGLKPLHMLMLTNRRLQCLEQLLKYNCDINAKEVLGNTILQILIMLEPHGTDVILKLLHHGSNPNSVNAVGNNCLHNVSILNANLTEKKSTILAEALIDHGLEVNAPNKIGNAPLHFAVKGNEAFVRVLLENGADLNQVNTIGQTPFDIATQDDNNLILNHLIKYVVLREHMGLEVKQSTLEKIKSGQLYQKIRKRFEDEMLALKAIKVNGYKVLSYYDLLFDKRARRRVIKNIRVCNKLNLELVQYSAYKNELMFKLNTEIERQNFIDTVCEHLDIIFRKRVTYLIVRKVACFVKKEDLNKLIEVANRVKSSAESVRSTHTVCTCNQTQC